MSEQQFEKIGIYCMNEVCEEYQKIRPDQVITYKKRTKSFRDIDVNPVERRLLKQK